MTNSLKHAFPDGQKGNLRIKMHSVDGKNYELVVKDDGIGIPGNLNMEKPETLGLKLIDSLVKLGIYIRKDIKDSGEGMGNPLFGG